MSTTVTYTVVTPTNPPMPSHIVRASDGATIPLDAGNMDYVAFKAWVAAGNTPAGAPWPPAGGAP